MKSIYYPIFALLILWTSSCNQPAATDPESADTTMEATNNEENEMSSDQFGGLALYTIRDTMASDPKAALKAVADLGYLNVEAAGWKDGNFYGMPPADFKAYLAELGLNPISSHMGGATLENLDQMIADVKAVGFEYFVLPVPPMGAFQYDAATMTLSMNKSPEAVLADVNMIAQKVHDAGLKCLYHNHDFEFKADENGIVPIDYFLENSDPKILNFEMDLYWVTRAGADPVDYFNRYPGRFKAWHVKDMDTEGRFAEVGAGTIDFKRILAAKETSGMEFYLVEQDMTFTQTPMEAIADSHKGLKEIGFK